MIDLYLDTADTTAAEPLLELGIFRGVTTNPTILQRAGRTVDDIPDLYAWAVDVGLPEIYFQAWGSTADDLETCGKRLAALGPQVVVKVPATHAGVAAARRLTGAGIGVLLTAVYNVSQAVLGDVCGAKFIAPYLGRMADLGRQAHTELTAMHQLLRSVGSTTRLLVASIRTPADVIALAQHGIDAFALPTSVVPGFFQDPSTEAATAVFEQAAIDGRH